MMFSRKNLVYVIFFYCSLAFMVSMPLVSVSAMSAADDPNPGDPSSNNPHQAGNCLGCHSFPNLQGRTADGDLISLSIQANDSDMNFHTQAGVGCKFCHLQQGEYPHGAATFDSCAVCHTMNSQTVDQNAEFIFELPFATVRDFSNSLNGSCSQCHKGRAEQIAASAHTTSQTQSELSAPGCVDCHGAHNISAAQRDNQSDVCKRCHEGEYSQYKSSVHGSALEINANPDVPTCGGCHGVHTVKGPSNSDFRQIAATEICGKCHSDPKVMDKYGISTDVVNTYMDDIHGKTNLMGRVNRIDDVKATCYDCHGVHDILSPSNPYSDVYPENLQSTCAKCHENANISFPSAWLSHKKPDLQHTPVLYLVNNYSFNVVVVVVIVILVWITLDLRRYNAVILRKKEDANHER